MLGGTYRGAFISRLTGSSTKPIVLRQWPGERATIDGGLDIQGAYGMYWGFEVFSSDPQRVSSQTGSAPTDLPRLLFSLDVSAPFNKLVHLVVHDIKTIFAGNLAEGLEIYGCIVYNNGWQGADRGHGHNLYLQNAGATKRITDNILFNPFEFNLQIYGTGAASLLNIDIVGNTMFGAGEPTAWLYGNVSNIVQYGGGPGRLGNLLYQFNSIYSRAGTAPALGFGTAGGLPGFNLRFLDNIVHGKPEFLEWQDYTIQRNTFSNGVAPQVGNNHVLFLTMPVGKDFTIHQIDRNRYIFPSTGPAFYLTGSGQPFLGLLPAWRTRTGYDLNSVLLTSPPNAADVIIRPSPYERGTAMITVWNWSSAGSVMVDASNVLSAGQRFVIRNVYDPYGIPLVDGTFTGSPIVLPIIDRSPPMPVGTSHLPMGPGTFLTAYKLELKI